MKILIITQKVDKKDPILGFFHKWIEEFSQYFEKTTVICLQKGEYDFSNQIKVLSLGKEAGLSKFHYLKNFYKYITKERENYDTVFIHMNPVYVVLGGVLWKLWNKKINLWYVHRQTNVTLRVAALFADNIFTASKESFNLKSKKVSYLGQAIDIDKFKILSFSNTLPKKISTIGRITRIKNLDVFIRAVEILNKKYKGEFVGSIVGGTVTNDDQKYFLELKKQVDAKDLDGIVEFKGEVDQTQIPQILEGSFVTVNLTPTGGWDKSVLESLASGRPVFTSNKAFKSLFGDQSGLFIFKEKDAEDLSLKVERFIEDPQKEKIIENISNKVRSEYDLKILISKISSIIHGKTS